MPVERPRELPGTPEAGRPIERSIFAAEIFANNRLEAVQVKAMFPGVLVPQGEVPREVKKRTVLGEPIEPLPGITLRPVNSTLGLITLSPNPDGSPRFGIVGNTVQRLCPHGENCSGHAQKAYAFADRLETNCASANTEAVFRDAGQAKPEGRFMMVPTSDDVLVLGKDEDVFSEFTLTDQDGKPQTAFNKLKAARAVVIGEKWAQKSGMIDGLTIGLNGADSTFGTMALKVGGENFVVAFCTTRENMGDRTEEFQVLRKAVDAIFDVKGITGEKREKQMEALNVRVDLVASATSDNFAHKILVPEPGSQSAQDLADYLLDNHQDEFVSEEAAQGEPDAVRQAARGEIKKRIVQTNNYLQVYNEITLVEAGVKKADQADVDAAKKSLKEVKPEDLISPGLIIDWQYPGAVGRGNVWKKGESGMEQITSANNLKYGEVCFIDYRNETKTTIVKQLEEMGLQEENIDWHEDQAIDPASNKNDAASNRLEQNSGIPASQTDRTFNGVTIKFGKKR